MAEVKDPVARYIELKQKEKEVKEQYRALETIIFNNDNHRSDERIKVLPGRKTITIKEDAYENLMSVGVEVYVTDKRHKKLDEFDVDIQKALLENPENYEEKLSKEQIRIKK